MKITPLEIRQKSFEKVLRGYDKDEVAAFLTTLSQEWERLIDETKELKIKYESSEREVSKLREVESSLYKTLKTAEDTGANLIDQANKAAELHLRETQLKAEAILNESREKAKNIQEETEMLSRQITEEMEERLKELVDDYKNLDLQRENLLADLKRISVESLDRLERTKREPFSPEQYLSKAKREIKRLVFPNAEPAPRAVAPEPVVAPAPPEPVVVIQETIKVVQEVVVAPPAPAQPQATSRSFFDDIE